MYLLVFCDEDGDVIVQYLERALLESRLDENYYGIENFLDPGAAEGIPYDPMKWPSCSALIVEAKSVVCPVEVATSWRLP